MKRTVAVAFMLCIPLLTLGCNAKTGVVVLDTIPQQATVYLNEERVGETPVTFGLDLRKPVTLKILKEGYVPQTEFLHVAWVRTEYRAGRYTVSDFLVQGMKEKNFEVRTVRVLREDGNVQRFREFNAWCDSMVGKDYHDVVKGLGFPEQTIDMTNGNKTMIFERGFQEHIPKFETDPSGIIVGWTF